MIPRDTVSSRKSSFLFLQVLVCRGSDGMWSFPASPNGPSVIISSPALLHWFHPSWVTEPFSHSIRPFPGKEGAEIVIHSVTVENKRKMMDSAEKACIKWLSVPCSLSGELGFGLSPELLWLFNVMSLWFLTLFIGCASRHTQED